MPISKHLAIRDAAAALLLVAPAVASGQVKVGSRRPMPQVLNAQVFVDIDETTVTPASLSQTEWNTRLRIECVTRDTATDAMTSADTLMVAVHDRLMADPTLAGKAIDTKALGLAWRPDDEAESGLAACQALFVVRHRTPRSSIAV